MRGYVDEAIAEKVSETLEASLSENTTKGLKKHLDSIINDLEADVLYRLKEELAPNLAAFVYEMATSAVSALLNGNEQAMRAYLSCQENGWTGRSTGYTTRGASDMHPVIHGTLFEAECIQLRRKIVEAHRDLLVNERILDLEDQVKSLVAQVKKATEEKERALERLRY